VLIFPELNRPLGLKDRMNNVSTALPSQALALRDPWSLVPSLGNLDAYISAVNRLPMLTHAEELSLAQRLRAEGDLQSAGRLVLSHLRLVVSVSRQYMGYGLPQGDLIQEGNVGLMKAVKRFDPEQGVRLVSYALHWIRAEIHEYILKNWRMVKVATTKAQRKLFFNLRSMKARLKGAQGATLAAAPMPLALDDDLLAAESPPELLAREALEAHSAEEALQAHQAHEALASNTYRSTLSPSEVAAVARELNVKPEEVVEMETRLSGADIALEPQGDDDDEAFAPIAYLADDTHEPTRALEARRRDWLSSDGIAKALHALDDRSRRIVEQRWLVVNDDSSGGMTLHELAAEYGVSAERVRQIETAALKKMRKALETEAA
jgi:RNA polymerase sigma-32 factor